MPGEYTPNFHLKKLGPGDHLSDESFKFSDADRDTIDRLLGLGATGHHHDGATASSTAPTAPTLTAHTSGGTIPAGRRVFYKVALVDPTGFESVASPEAFVDTPSPVSAPAAPALELVATGGILLPGSYNYVLTAYAPTNTQETQAGTPNFVVIASGTTNEIVIHFPAPPVGAEGFNIYRRKPGATAYHYLASVPVVGGATPDPYTDDGSVTEDCDRRPPTNNQTGGGNSIDVTLADTLPDGWTWRVYRTYAANNYTNSLLHWVVEETFEGSGIITTTYTDIGGGTSSGEPLSNATTPDSPSKILLTGMGEVQGRLPLAGVQTLPQIVSFAMTGVVTVTEGKVVWICEFPVAKVVGVRLGLGKGYAPAATEIIVDVNKGSGTSPTYASIFSVPTDRPTIAVGDQIGVVAVPVDGDANLVQGDSLTIDIVQSGGGATPTDYDLVVNLLVLGQFNNAVDDWSWS